MSKNPTIFFLDYYNLLHKFVTSNLAWIASNKTPKTKN